MKKVIYAAMSFAPVLALAQVNTTGAETLLANIKNLISNFVIPIIFALAIVYFFWGLLNFVRGAGDQKVRDEGKKQMIWGIIALAVMVSVYGLINWVTATANLNNNTMPDLPTIQ